MHSIAAEILHVTRRHVALALQPWLQSGTSLHHYMQKYRGFQALHQQDAASAKSADLDHDADSSEATCCDVQRISSSSGAAVCHIVSAISSISDCSCSLLSCGAQQADQEAVPSTQALVALFIDSLQAITIIIECFLDIRNCPGSYRTM